VPNNTSLTVMQILQIANANYNPSTGLFYGGDSTKTADLNNVTNGINQSGDITQVADNSSTAADNLGGLLKSIYDLNAGTLAVYVDNSNGYVTPDEQARIDDAIASIDANLGAFGVNLVDITATDTTGGAAADIVIQIADTSALGGVAQGILGVYEMGGMITLVNGWNWYTGSDPTQIGVGQYDFQTTATHELGHALGLGGSDDTNSPMFESLPPGVTRRTLTASDLSVVENDAANPAPDPERAAPANGAHGDVIEGRNLLVASPGLPVVQAGGSALESSSGSSLSISTAGSQDDVPASIGFTLTASFAPLTGSPASDTAALHDRAGDLLFSELGRTTALAPWQGLGGAVDNVAKNLNGEHISAKVQPVTPLVVAAPGRHDLGAIDQVTGTGNVPSRPLEAWIGAGVDGDGLFIAALVGVGTANLSSLVFEKDTDEGKAADPALSLGLKRKRFWE
jgi:hypothetical protein